MKLNRVRVNREPPREPNLAVPTRPGRAEPWPAQPDHALATTAHRPSLAARVAAWVDRLRGDNAARAEGAQRQQWAKGYAGGRTVERAEIEAELRRRLLAGHYDLRKGNDAVREILAYLTEEPQPQMGSSK